MFVFSATLCLFLLSFERRRRSMLTKRMIAHFGRPPTSLCLFFVRPDQSLHPSSKPSVYLCIVVWLPLFVYLFVFDIVCLFICCLFPRPDQWLLFICLCHCLLIYLPLTLFVCLFILCETRPFIPQNHLFILISLFVCLCL